jgi:predicted alpha/beta hydrolase
MEETVVVNSLKNGAPLSVTVFGAVQTGPVVLVGSATGIKQGFYRRFCAFLVEQLNCTCLTFDFQGIGASPVDPDSEKGSISTEKLKKLNKVNLSSYWYLGDLPAVSNYLNVRFKERSPKVFIGHSAAAHAVLVSPGADEIFDRFILACAGSPNYVFQPNPVFTLIGSYLYMPITNALYGYFPASKLGLGEDLPAGVGRQWLGWAKYRGYYMDARKDLREKAEKWNPKSALVMTFQDDDFSTTSKAFEEFYEYCKQANSTNSLKHLHLPGTIDGLKRTGHNGLFFDSHKEGLWTTLLAPYIQKGEVPAQFEQFQLRPKRSKL